MPHPLDNPFRKKTPPTKSEAGVIGSLLGDAAQTAFEAVGGSNTIDDDEYFLDEGFGETGRRLQREADNVLERDGKWTRKRYVLWAESFNEDEDWVDEHFVFQDDGTTITPGDIDLKGKKLTELPKGWIRVEGNCELAVNQLTSLVGAPKSVGGNFSCSCNKLTSLAGAPESIGVFFYCNHNKLTSLVGAPKSVGGSFICYHNQLTSLDDLPKDIGGVIFATHNLLTPEAIARAKAKWDNINI